MSLGHMSDTESNEIANLRAILEEDSKAPYPKYPSLTLLALKDERLVNALIVRLRNKQTLSAIKALPYSAATGLHFIYFEFSPKGFSSIGSDCCLVILNEKSGVVGLVDPFDYERPNPSMPPLPQSEYPESPNRMPFVLSRPSATENLRFSQQALSPAQARTQAFFSQLGGVGGFGGAGGIGGVVDADGRTLTDIQTQTVWHHGGWTPGPYHWVEYDTQNDQTADDYIA